MYPDGTFEGKVRMFSCISHRIKFKFHMKILKTLIHSFDIFSQKLSFVLNLVLDSDENRNKP